MSENWKGVEGYEGIYQVSSLGRVKSFCHDRVVGQILNPCPSSCGYLAVGLFRDGEGATTLVHRLIAEAFLGPAPSPDHEVNHRNGDKHDNRVENLEWVTHSENQAHASENGLMPRGEANGRSRLTEDDVLKIRRLYATGQHTMDELGKIFGVDLSNISYIVHGKTWAHVGGPIAHGNNTIRGEAHNNARLTEDDVRKICCLYDAGQHTQKELAEMFGISRANIGRIVRRETWKHV